MVEEEREGRGAEAARTELEVFFWLVERRSRKKTKKRKSSRERGVKK